MDRTTTLWERKGMRLFITCKADVRAINQGLKEPREFSVFTDHENLDERKKGILSATSLNFNKDGHRVIGYDAEQVLVLPLPDGAGYEIVFASTPAQQKFIELMKLLPLERGVLV
ncbi:hypothetical protein I8H89_02680 [Candidatus Saccharibacteria bacterium]|nr:hypothetical protein [Candidatus Saccharibacteria bacterium]